MQGEVSVRRKKIIYFSHTRQVSGAERVLLDMLAVLDRDRYEAVVACPVVGLGNLDQLVGSAGVEVLPIAPVQARFTSNPFKLLRYLQSFLVAVARTRGTLRRAAPDLIHANSVRAGIIATIATAGSTTPVLWHIQDDLPEHPISTLIRLLARFSERTRFVSVSRHTAAAFEGNFRFSLRMNVLHNGVDLARFPRKTSADRESEFRRGLGLGPDDLLFVSIGMINPRKGLLELVEAFALAKDELPAKTHLALVGAPIFNRDDLYLARIEERVAALSLEERIHLPGPSSDVAAVLRTANLLILNASVEPFGLVLVEAASSGTPILATEVGGAKDILATDPPCAFLTLPPQISNARLLADRLISISSDEEGRKIMADLAYNEVRSRFSLEVFERNLNALYADLFSTTGSDHHD